MKVKMNLTGCIKLRNAYCPEICLEGMRKSMKDVMNVGVSDEIQAAKLRNTH